MKGIAFGRLPSKKDTGVSAEKRELVKAMRTQVKEALEKAAARYCFIPMEQALSDLRHSGGLVETLVDLTLEFGERLTAKKQEKNVLDFGDIEHYALQIMLEETEDGFAESAFVRGVTGVGNVCERAALKSAGTRRLLIPKTAREGVTVAAAVTDYTLWMED